METTGIIGNIWGFYTGIMEKKMGNRVFIGVVLA